MATISGSRAASGSLQQQAAPSSHQYTCNTCQVAFRFADTQKGHMKSDWHRYNLKRRVASLPPISSEVFTEKVLQARAATTAEADKAGFQQVCEVCQKTYFSENSYRNHLGSQKHKAKEMAAQRGQNGVEDDAASSVMSSTFSLGEPVPVEPAEVDSDAEQEFNSVIEGIKKSDLSSHQATRPSPVKRPANPTPLTAEQHNFDRPASDIPSEATSGAATPIASITLNSCLFCNYNSPTVPLNLVHMERIHGMFVPEKQYLVDVDGLLQSLQQRIQDLHECLYCGKLKNNAFAVQTHMRDKGHCKIPFTTEEEQLMIGEFYDFRSTYSDEEGSDDESQDGDKLNGGAKLGGKRSIKTTGEDGDELMDGEDEGWETDSTASSVDSEEIRALPVDHHPYERLDKHPHHSSHDPRHHHQADGWHSHAHKHGHAVFYDDYELHLPSGRSVGHRSLAKYYRQNLHSHPSAEEHAERLAIEGADSSDDEDAMDVDGESNGDRRIARRENGGPRRAVISRADGGIGMLGVGEQKKREVKKEEKRSRKQEQAAQKKQQWALNKQNNHQKHYNYQIL